MPKQSHACPVPECSRLYERRSALVRHMQTHGTGEVTAVMVPAPVDVPEERCAYVHMNSVVCGQPSDHVLHTGGANWGRHRYKPPAPTPEPMQDERAPSDFADLSYHFPQLWPAPEGRTHEQVELNRTTFRPAPETMSVEEAEVSEPYCEACDETGRCRVCFDRRGIWGNREAQVSALEAALAEERQQHARLEERIERAENQIRYALKHGLKVTRGDVEAIARALAPSEPVGG
jgi:hypothetical protein